MTRKAPGASHRRDDSPVSAVLIAVQSPERDDLAVQRSMAELTSLAAGLGLAVTHTAVQRRAEPAPQTWLGEGKLREIAELTGGSGEVPRGLTPPSASDQRLVVLADDELSPAQRRNLEGALGVPILDRTEVILRVFEARAKSRDAKLQVELARLQVELPRIRDDHSMSDREGGGGRAARGASNVELAKQRLRTRMAAIRTELANLGDQTAPRDGDDPLRVALVGYTNVGKSTLMRALTGSDVLVADKLFATLGTTTRQLSPPWVPPLVMVDSVGFLDRLPHGLIASFRSTLSEARDSDLLLLVVDASDPAAERQLAVTHEVLAEIGAAELPWLLVLNKADRLDADQRAAWLGRYPQAVLVSALQPGDVVALRAAFLERLAESLQTEVMELPWSAAQGLAAMRGHIQVLHEDSAETLTVTVRGRPAALAKLRSRVANQAVQ
jgi:GTP-binding protein HflX